MLLKDLLSKSVIDDLNNIKGNKNNKNNKNNSKKRKTKDNKIEKKKTPVSSGLDKDNNKKPMDIDPDLTLDLRYEYKKHYIDECPYCSSKELEVTGNGYYYCECCGFKVDKIFKY